MEFMKFYKKLLNFQTPNYHLKIKVYISSLFKFSLALQL